MQMFILRVYNIKYQPPYRPIEPHTDEHEEFSEVECSSSLQGVVHTDVAFGECEQCNLKLM